MALRPYRSHSEYDVVNFFALDVSSGDAGNFVEMVSGQPDKLSAEWDLSSVGNFSSVDGVFSRRASNPAKIKISNSGSGSKVLGIMLYDVREYDENGNKLVYSPSKQDERSVVLSGQAVPVLTRGLVSVNNIEGTPAAGSGLGVGLNGKPKVMNENASIGVYGRFLTSTGAAGYAIAKLEI